MEDSIIFFSTIPTFIVINLGFISLFKNMKTKWLFVLFTSLLLIISVQPNVMLGYQYAPYLLLAISIEGFTFAKIFGKTKWVHTVLSSGILLGTIILCIKIDYIPILLISFVLIGGIFSLLLWYANKQEHFFPKKQ